MVRFLYPAFGCICKLILLGTAVSRVHAFFIIMGGYMLVDVQGQPICPLTYNEIITLTKEGKISLSHVKIDDIKDKSKGDPLSKVVVLIQTTWFILQTISRRVIGVSVTPLENSTFAFAVLNILTYLFWWHKPLSVDSPIRLLLVGSDIESPCISHSLDAILPTHSIMTLSQVQSSRLRRKQYSMTRYITRPVHYLESFITSDPGVGSDEFEYAFRTSHKRLPSFFSGPIMGQLASSNRWGNRITICTAAQVILALLLNCFHTVAMFWQFPAKVECYWWGFACVFICFAPLVISVCTIIFPGLCPDFMVRFLNIFMLLLYIIARLSHVVIAFTTLQDLPPDTYVEVDWTSYIPHI